MNLIEEEQIAAQLVAVMDAHFSRPSPEQKRRLLALAAQQIAAAETSASFVNVLKDFDHAA